MCSQPASDVKMAANNHQDSLQEMRKMNAAERNEVRKNKETVVLALKECTDYGRIIAWQWVEKAIRLKVDVDRVIYSELFFQYSAKPTHGDVEVNGLNLSQVQIMLEELTRALSNNCLQCTRDMNTNEMRKKLGTDLIKKTVQSLKRQQSVYFEHIRNLELTAIQSRTLDVFRKIDIDHNGFVSEENFLQQIEVVCFPSQIAIAQLDHQGGIFMIGKLGA